MPSASETIGLGKVRASNRLFTLRRLLNKYFIVLLPRRDFTLRRDKSLCISLYERENG
jgi:hypothetical protein